MDMLSKEMLVFKSTSKQNNTGIAVISFVILGLVQALFDGKGEHDHISNLKDHEIINFGLKIEILLGA